MDPRAHARDDARRTPRRDAISRVLNDLHRATDRDRFAALDRRMMPDRLRVPPAILALFAASPR